MLYGGDLSVNGHTGYSSAGVSSVVDWNMADGVVRHRDGDKGDS